jgi:hypothetical protein
MTGMCSLRAAIQTANVDPQINVITFSISGNAPFTISLAGRLPSPLASGNNLEIDGGLQAGEIIIRGIDGDRVFHIAHTGVVSVTLDALIFENSHVASEGGGVILAENSTLSISNSEFRNNSAPIGGAIAVASSLDGSMTSLWNNVFTNNSATYGGAVEWGGRTNDSLSIYNNKFIGNDAHFGGGLYIDVITADITPSLVFGQNTFIDNSAVEYGGGGYIRGYFYSPNYFEGNSFSKNIADYGGGLYLNVSANHLLKLDRMQFEGNVAVIGGGIWAVGGDIDLQRALFTQNEATNVGGGLFVGPDVKLEISNSTLSGNSAMYSGAGLVNAGSTIIRNVTVTGNTAGRGGDGLVNYNSFTLYNTIVAHNDNLNCEGEIINGADNMQYPGMTCGSTIPSADPLLLPLGDNGGNTLTHSLAVGSPALNTGSNGHAVILLGDQRGYSRIVGETVDLGAIEIQ